MSPRTNGLPSKRIFREDRPKVFFRYPAVKNDTILEVCNLNFFPHILCLQIYLQVELAMDFYHYASCERDVVKV